MISKRNMGLPAILGIALVVLVVYFLRPEPLQANVSFAGQTGQGCATCHYDGTARSAANLTPAGQEFVRCGYILNCGPATSSPGVAAPQQPSFQGPVGNSTVPAQASGFQPGKIWIVQLREANGRFADIIWTKRGNSNSFDVLWHLEGNRFADVMNYEGYRNGQVSFYSSALKSRFTGTPSPNGVYIFNGRVTGGDSSPSDSWTASIF